MLYPKNLARKGLKLSHKLTKGKAKLILTMRICTSTKGRKFSKLTLGKNQHIKENQKLKLAKMYINLWNNHKSYEMCFMFQYNRSHQTTTDCK